MNVAIDDAVCYRIRNWDENYESNQSRAKCPKAMPWVRIRTRHDTTTFGRVMRADRSGGKYGAWILLVTIAAKCAIRGMLVHNSGPLEPADIAEQTGLSEEAVIEALEFFSSPSIGWLEEVSKADFEAMQTDSHHSRTEVRMIRTTSAPKCEKSAPIELELESELEGDKEQEAKTKTQRRKRGEAAAAGQESKAVFEAWNTIAHVSSARELTPARQRAIKARLAEPFFREHWPQAIDRVRRSRFCQGGGTQGWKADLDWFLRPDTCAKILEGKFDDRAAASPKQPELGAGIRAWYAKAKAEQSCEPPLQFSHDEGGQEC